MYPQQQPVQKKPIAAAVLSIIAGAIGLVMSLAMVALTLYAMALVGSIGDVGGIVGGIVAIAVGLAMWLLIASLLVLVGGIKVYSHPEQHTKWGVIILLFSIIGLGLFFLSVTTDWTGILGSVAALMGIIGGILALAFKPAVQYPRGYQQPYAQTGYPPPPPQAGYQQPYASQQQFRRICPQCGRVVDENVRFCPNCGKALA
jgi:hypothetical protein